MTRNTSLAVALVAVGLALVYAINAHANSVGVPKRYIQDEAVLNRESRRAMPGVGGGVRLGSLLKAVRGLDMYRTMSPSGLAINTGEGAGGNTGKFAAITSFTTYVQNGTVRQWPEVAVGTAGEITDVTFNFTATTHDITASASAVREAVYLYYIDSDQDSAVLKGTEASGSGNAVVPETPSGGVPVGYLRVAVAAGATDFDAGSDDVTVGGGASHLTTTLVELTVNPADLDIDSWDGD